MNLVRKGLTMPTTSYADNYYGYEGWETGRWVVLFGGRSNDIRKEHRPKTYEIKNDQGVLYIEDYQEKEVESSYATADSMVNVGLYFNDVWAYPIGERE